MPTDNPTTPTPTSTAGLRSWRATVTREFTGNLDRHRQTVERVYPGPLCIQHGRNGARRLAADQTQIDDDPAVRPSSLSRGRAGDHVVAAVAVADRATVAQATSLWGGAVEVHG